MALDMQGLRLTNDHTLETASEVMSQLQFDRRLPNGRQSYLELLEDLGFRSNQDGEEHTQFVFQGQCLILGDARVGKTSLKKSLMGEAFDSEESRTKGVEVSLVDRKWKNLDANTGISFGSFARYGESFLYEAALYGPGGIEFSLKEEVTSTTFTTAGLNLFKLLGIIWTISIVWLLAYATVSVGFYVFSFAVFSVAMFVYCLYSTELSHGFTLVILFTTLPRFIVGLGTAYLLTGLHKGTECNTFEFSSSEINVSSNSGGIWEAHLLICATMFNYLVNTLFLETGRYFNILNLSGNVESSVPGQVKFNSSVPILPRISSFIIPIIGGFSFACIVELSTKTSNLKYYHTFHLTMIPICCIVIYKLSQALSSWFSWQGVILLLYITMDKVRSLTSFFPLYIGLFAIWACNTLYTDWDDMFFIFNNIGRETRASFTFILIEKVMLNFQKLKIALHNKFSGLKLKLLDFAGDEEYYAYHHIFMRDQAIYIVVFNMTNFADNNFRNIEAKTQRLSFWLESICSKTAPKTPIFLVGTHKGHMDKTCLQRIDKHLRQHILHSFSDELVINKEDNLVYFPTENTLGRKDRGIQNLQKEIMSTAEERKTSIGREIPYSWIKIQDAIINLRQNKNAKFCVPLQKFPISVGNFICSNWSKETLKFFHEKGLIIYANRDQNSDMSEWILLKPDILVDIIIQLVTPLQDEEVLSQRGFRRDWELLHDTGMLTESLLENILSRLQEDGNALKGFLVEYDIICPLFFNVTKREEEAQVTHFVPSLLPMSADVNTPVWQDSPDDKKFYVFFHRFLPEPLFQHLLSRAHKNSRAEFTMGQPAICKDNGRFWLRPSQPYRLLQLKDEDMIEVTFNYREPGQEMKPSDVLVYISGMISYICKQHFPYVKFHCGPLCPSDKCPGYQGDYISHPGVQRACSRQRRHVFNVMPARQEAKDASFFCVNQNFKEQLKEWVV